MATMPRSLRIPEDVWNAAVAKAKAEDTTVTTVVVAALEEYLKSGPSMRLDARHLAALRDTKDRASAALYERR